MFVCGNAVASILLDDWARASPLAATFFLANATSQGIHLALLMKKSVFSAGLLLLSGAIAAVAAPFTSKGIPDTVQGIVHVDLEAFLKSSVGQAVQKKAGESTGADGKSFRAQKEELQKEFGLDIFKDFSSITAGVIAPGQKSDGEPEFVVIVRGKFTPSKFLAGALNKKGSKKSTVKLVHIGEYPFLKGKKVVDLVGDDDEGLLGIFDPNTLILIPNGKEALAKAAIAALEGTGKSFAAPAALTAQGKQVGTPLVLAYLDGKIFGDIRDPDVLPPKKAHLALGESGPASKLRVALEYATAADAQKTQATVQATIGMLQMFALNPAGDDGKPDPKKVAQAAQAKKFFDALKINVTGNAFVVALDIASADIVQAMTENMK
ncbi:MAG: hypothetical protein LBD14_03765 [Puniceicoccales bacterium]|nr:hypothetical protein [Puniceicoccales bacterium]